MTSETTLITGASSGIGFELAREFARHGHPLILTARSDAELQEAAQRLKREFSVPVRAFAFDLAEPGAAQNLFDEVMRAGEPIEILVNNAGFGRRGSFWQVPLDDYLGMIRVNIESLVTLTRLVLPSMIERGHGRILQLGSIAGFEPGPTLAVYHATKAFVVSLSEALASELEDSGVTITALCPGATDTDFFPKADMVDSTIFQKGSVMAPQEVAEAGYSALMQGDSLIVPGFSNKALVFARRLLPRSTQASINRMFYFETDDIERVPGEIREAEEVRSEK